MILTDPFISTRTSPVPLFGPKIIVPLGIAMHWGTVNLSDEPMFEPPVLFKKAGEKRNKHTIIMKIGETKKM